MDLVDRRVTRSSSPKTLTHLGKALRGLAAELSHGWADSSVVFLSVGLLACHDLDEEKMTAMYGTSPLQFVPLVHLSENMRVLLQLGYNDVHVQAKGRIVNQIGGLEKISIPGLGDIAAYLELANSSKLYQLPRYENFWHAERLANLTKLGPGLLGKPLASGGAGRGFFLHAQQGLTPRSLSILMQLSAVNERLKHETVQNAETAPEPDPHLLRLLHKLQHQLLSLPNWDDLDSREQKASVRHVYDCVRLAAVIYSNAVLLALPHHTGWHTALSHRLRDLIDLNDWRDDMTMYPVLPWVLTVGGIAAYRSQDRVFYEETLTELLQIMDSPSWKAVERTLGGFLWSRQACKHGAAMLWQGL
nr:hypothetical protein B0A51_10532 [Rachicladosporium sp. CCFEE 5018]